MKEKVLLRIAWITSFVGVLFLLILCFFLRERIDIGIIDDSYLDGSIFVEGRVSGIRESSKITMFDLEDDSGKIKVVVFTEEKIYLEEEVGVQGTLTEYEGEYEIIAERILE